MRVLVVEDDPPLASMLARTLREEHYAVDTAGDGQEAEWLAFENPYDAIVLDLMLPIKDGFTVLQSLRKGGINTPILILTAKDSKDDVVRGLDLGADDYLTKPFDIDELLARIRALFRRPSVEVQSTISVGPLEINPSTKRVTRDGVDIVLTAKEYALLEFMARRAGNVLSRTELSEHVWDMNYDPMSNVVDVYVGYLRTKVDKDQPFPMIKTIRGHGYMLEAPQGNVTQPAKKTQISPHVS